MTKDDAELASAYLAQCSVRYESGRYIMRDLEGRDRAASPEERALWDQLVALVSLQGDL